MTEKITKGFLVTIMSLCGILFAFLFVNCIYLYNDFDVRYNDLMFAVLKYERYEVENDTYEIYFKEFEEPFEVSSITQKRLKKDKLSILEEDDKIDVYYRESDSKKFKYEICEFSSNSMYILTLYDFIDVNQSNQTIGMVLCPMMVSSSIFIIIITLKYKQLNNIDNLALATDLGYLKIEYKVDGYVIRVYNSPTVCSLVINDKVVDRYIGFVASNFVLNGEVEVGGKKIKVEARMGFVNMRLFYDEKEVDKKFMGLG